MKRLASIDNTCYFVTTNIYRRQNIFNDDQTRRLLINVLSETRGKYHYLIHGYVIMPDHVHLLITPHVRNQISDAMRFIKGLFARRYAEGKSLGYAQKWPPTISPRPSRRSL